MSYYPDVCFLKSAAEPHQWVPDEGMEVAFAGRSNAGKSSAINVILGRRGFARVSKTPGRTQLINFFGLDEAVPGGRRLVDLPGYGFARVPPQLQHHWQRLMEAYFTERRSLSGLMLIVDVRRGLLDGDRRMLDWAAQAGRGVHVLLTKADKLKRGQATSALQEVRRELAERAGASAQLFSSHTGEGAPAARQALELLAPVPDATMTEPGPASG
jgi:GTP-binding protein